MTVIAILFGILAAAFIATVYWLRTLRPHQFLHETEPIRAMYPHALAGLSDMELLSGELSGRRLWRRIHGRQGLRKFAFNARCLVSIVQILAAKQLVKPSHLRYVTSRATTIIVVASLCYPAEATLRLIGLRWLPYISAQLCASMYAELEARVQTLLEGKNGDALDQLRAVL